MPSTTSAADNVRLVDRVLDLLEALAEPDQAQGPTELARRTGMDKATAHRLLRSLARRGYVTQEVTSRRYRLSSGAIRLARRALQSTPAELAAPHLRRLADAVGEQATLWVLDGADAICVAKAESSHGLRTHTELGVREPAATIAAGRCLLAAAMVRDALPEGADLASATELRSIAERGVAVVRGLRWPGVNAVGVPVLDGHGVVVAALGLSAPDQRFRDRDVDRLADAALATAAALSAELGGRDR